MFFFKRGINLEENEFQRKIQPLTSYSQALLLALGEANGYSLAAHNPIHKILTKLKLKPPDKYDTKMFKEGMKELIRNGFAEMKPTSEPSYRLTKDGMILASELKQRYLQSHT